MVSYRDIAARGTPHSSFLANGSRGTTNGTSIGNVAFGPVQPDPAVLSTVVGAVMAALTGRAQHF